MTVEPSCEGFCFGESANHIQKLYGFLFLFSRDLLPAPHVPKEGLNSHKVFKKPAPIELQLLVIAQYSFASKVLFQKSDGQFNRPLEVG